MWTVKMSAGSGEWDGTVERKYNRDLTNLDYAGRGWGEFAQTVVAQIERMDWR